MYTTLTLAAEGMHQMMPSSLPPPHWNLYSSIVTQLVHPLREAKEQLWGYCRPRSQAKSQDEAKLQRLVQQQLYPWKQRLLLFSLMIHGTGQSMEFDPSTEPTLQVDEAV